VRVLITGGTGFLGCHLARRLVRDGHAVRLLDLQPLDARDLVGAVEVIGGDVREASAVDRAVKGTDVVVHAAAALPIQRSRGRIFGVNVAGTATVLEWCLRHDVRRVVFISSTAVYGVPREVPETEDTPLRPLGWYGESKAAAERLCEEFGRRGLSINILRPKTILGPERLGVFQLWFEAIYRGKRVFLLGEGNNRFQLLAVEDAVEAIWRAAHCDLSGAVLNLGAAEFGTWRDDLGAVIDAAQSAARLTSLPAGPAQALLWALEQLHLSPLAAWHYRTLPLESYVAIGRARAALGWRPTQSNRELLTTSYAWYAAHRGELLGRRGVTHRAPWDFDWLTWATRFPW
jgi:nucleoside-diphosphate-sugar epimerase